MFLWTDLETTGLDPVLDVPLSIGIVITDDALREVARREWVIGWNPHHPSLVGMSDFVRAMHTTNGLLERVQAAWLEFPLSLNRTEVDVCEFLTKHLGAPDAEIKNRPPWAGNTVHFDKAFVERHLPQAAKFYNYRCLDVSTLKVIAQAIAPGAREWCKAKEGQAAHTPLKDIDASIAEFAHWRRELFKPEVGCCPAFAITHRGPPIIGNTPSTYEPCTLLPGHMPPCKP